MTPEDFLCQTLSKGPVSYKKVRVNAYDNGITRGQLKQARKSLKIITESVKIQNQTTDWLWRLPT